VKRKEDSFEIMVLTHLAFITNPDGCKVYDRLRPTVVHSVHDNSFYIFNHLSNEALFVV
jgi:hypothetical protein